MASIAPVQAPPDPKAELPPPQELKEELQKALKALYDQFDVEDKDAYWRIAREAQLLEFYWRGIQDVIWDPISRDWMSAEGILQTSRSKDEVDSSIIEKNVNVYRANGESFVAALSSGLPFVRFTPNDADDSADITTAKAYSVLSELIQRHNKSVELFLHALYITWNGHFVAAYNYHGSDASFGTRETPVYALRSQIQRSRICPSCGENLETVQPMNEMGTPPSPEMEGMAPEMEEGPPPGGPTLQQGPAVSPIPQTQCPSCGEMVEPIDYEEEVEVPYIERYDTEFKTREIVEVYGPRQVRVPMYAKTLAACPYLVLASEHHVSQMLELFPGSKDKIAPPSPKTGDYVRMTRTNVYQTTTNSNVSTLQRIWFRPWAFNYLRDDAVSDQLKKAFPNGCLAYFVDDVFVDAVEESMDEHWTFVGDPLSEYIIGMPKGLPMKPIQDIVNDIENLGLETILHGIPETYADTGVLNFEKYADIESAPGQMIPATAKEGQTLSAGFHTIKATTLGREIGEYRAQQDTNAQFVTGILPSIYGGPLGPGQSRTLGVYQKSQSQALQRLSITWKMISEWWSQVMLKSCNSFRKHMKEDEHFAKKVGNTYMNLWVRRAELTGEVGSCEPESSEQFPVSWEQIRGMILELFQLKDPNINATFFDPQNVGYISRVLGFRDLKLPGDDDREKQLEEISDILKGQPIPTEPGVDNDQIHVATCTYYLNSEQGRNLKKVSPDLYGLILQHLGQHQMYLQQQMMQQQQVEAEAQAAAGGGKGIPKNNRPDQGASETPPEAVPTEQG